MRIYVGNLSYQTTENELRSTFEAYGTVDSANVVMDRESGRSKGFGFVDMGNQNEAENAIKELNGQSLGERTLTVNEARPRQEGGGRPNRNSRRY